MSEDDQQPESFEDMLRSFARELGRSAERMTQFDIDELAESVGIDPTRAREWADSAGKWLRDQVENLGDEFASRAGSAWPPSHDAAPPEPRPQPSRADSRHEARPDDPLRGAAPHPLDVPTDEQGIALAALGSGRWTVEPGTHALSSRGEGPGPSNSLGLVRELHARDWIDADGAITLVGRHALSRWMDASGAH